MDKYVYVLQVVKELEDEIVMVIDSVYTTENKAKAIGKMLEETKESNVLSFIVTRRLIFQ